MKDKIRIMGDYANYIDLNPIVTTYILILAENVTTCNLVVLVPLYDNWSYRQEKMTNKINGKLLKWHWNISYFKH